MSCYLIYYQDGAKYARPVHSPQEYLELRNSERQKELVAKTRSLTPNLHFETSQKPPSGEGSRERQDEAKKKLMQMAYSCIPNEDGTLRGAKRVGNSVGMDVDHIEADKLQEVIEGILAKKDELGLLMLERSARGEGLHAVFKRHLEMTNEENLRWASDLLGIEFDKGAKDITRVFFTTTGSSEDLLFLSEELFNNEPQTLPQQTHPQQTHPQPLPLSSQGSREGSGLETRTADVSKDSNVTTPLPSTEGAEREGQGEGLAGLAGLVLPYDQIIAEWAPTVVPSFPNITEGVRNTSLHKLCLGLRHLTEFKEERLKALVWPKYSFGMDEKEVDSIVRSVLMFNHGQMPVALENVVNKHTCGENDADVCPPLKGVGGSPYPSVSQCIVEEMSLPKFPKWVEKLLVPVLPGYRFITICGCSTAMMTLLSDVTKKFGSKPESRLNGWTHWDGLSGSGKRQLHDVIEELIKPLRAQDDKTRELLNGIIEFNKTAKDGEKKALPPLGIRILECDTTRKAHITQMNNLKGKKTFTFAEEISSLNLNRQGYYFRGDFCRLNFDNGMVGCLNATGDAASIVTPCNWDVTTSGTHDQTLKQWQNAIADGSAQRVLICLVPDNTYQPMPTYKQYTEEDEAYIARATSLLMKMQGKVETPRLDRAMNAWVENIRVTMDALPKAERNDEKARFRFRSTEIAHTLGVVMHCCFIVQEIMDTEDALNAELRVKTEELEAVRSDISSSCEQIAEAERAVIAAREALETWKSTALELDQYSENKAAIDLALYTADYCLDVQDLLWTKRLRAQQRASFEGISLTQSGRSSSEDCYLKLPERFTMTELDSILIGKSKVAIKQIVQRFMKSNMIRKTGTEHGFAVYEKVA